MTDTPEASAPPVDNGGDFFTAPPTAFNRLGSMGLSEVLAFSDQKRSARTPALQNGEKRFPSGDRYVTPDPAAIAALQSETAGKVSYFGAVGIDSIPDAAGYGGEPLFSEALFIPFLRMLQEKYAGQKIALRAIMTSLNGVQADLMGPGTEVLDLADTVAFGIEKPDEAFNVQVMSEDPDPHTVASGLKYISRYTYNQSFTLGFDTNPNADRAQAANAVFPAVLIYDANGLERRDSNRFHVAFAEGVNPQDVLLEACVLDRA